MRRRTVTLGICTLAALGLTAPAAGAKELQFATICGAERCVEVAPDDLSFGLIEGTQTTAPDRAEPWYRVRLGIGAEGRVHERFSLILLPRSGFLGGLEGPGSGFGWTRVDAGTAELYRELTVGLAPLPAARIDAKLPVNSPPPSPAPPPAAAESPGDDGDSLAGVVAPAVAAVALVGGAAVLLRRRRNAG